MNRIDSIFQSQRQKHRRGLMPFVCGGRPDAARLPDLLTALERAGASIVEIGFPFSDPIADGPVIAAAMHRALESGLRVDTLMDAVAAARPKVNLGLVAMVSVSIVHRYGVERFIRRSADAGFDGFIFPDAPADEAAPLLAAAAASGLTASLLVAPTTHGERLDRVVRASTGFVYLLARAGITGERDEAPQIEARVAEIRSLTGLPIACGFGISSPGHVREVVRHADAAIVGSALVRRVEDAIDAGADPVAAAERFTAELAAGLPA